jgi:plasmid stabilization system protein ParE
MPPFAVEVHPLAADEAEAAERWYRDRNETSATRFRRELDRAVGLIADRPDAAPPYVGNTRRSCCGGSLSSSSIGCSASTSKSSRLHTLDGDRTTGFSAEMTTGPEALWQVEALNGENGSRVALETCSLTLVSLTPPSVR